jgi:hypothetical protein
LTKQKDSLKEHSKKSRALKLKRILKRLHRNLGTMTPPRLMKSLKIPLLKLETISNSKLKISKRRMVTLRKMEDLGKRPQDKRIKNHLYSSTSHFSTLKTKSN